MPDLTEASAVPTLLSSRDIDVAQPWLLFPVKDGAAVSRIRISVDGEVTRSFDIELTAEPPDFWVFADVSQFVGRIAKVSLEGPPQAAKGLAAIRVSAALPDEGAAYHERHRPQFHYSPRRGWDNDPNGMVYYAGEYHFFYQHNPYGVRWANMHWGHAVSTDLVHWTELPEALYPDERGAVFSGSAVVDWNNTAGFQEGDEKALVLIYTAAGGTSTESAGQPFTQCLAYSNDRGRTWTKYAGNPVLAEVARGNRDPRVFWHQETDRWVMVLYLDGCDFGFFASSDLKQWTELSRITLPGMHEVPDLFPLAVDGDQTNVKWVFLAGNETFTLAANAWCHIGAFDGKFFRSEAGPFPLDAGLGCYSTQTFSDIPEKDDRRIQIAWMSRSFNEPGYPGMPFNGQFGFPTELTLRTLPDGIRLCRKPVCELETLHACVHRFALEEVGPQQRLSVPTAHDLLDIRAELDVPNGTGWELLVRGVPIAFDGISRQLKCFGQAAEMQGNVHRLQVLVDRTSLEVYIDEGALCMSGYFEPVEDAEPLMLSASDGHIGVKRLDVYELRSIWE